MLHAQPLRRAAAWLALSLTCAFGPIACEKSARDRLNEAGAAIAQEDPDRAEAALKEAVVKDPKLSTEVQRQMIKVHMLRGAFDKAEAELSGLWQELGLDGEGLSVSQKREKGLLVDRSTELYLAWASSIDAAQTPTRYEEVVRKGLARDPKHPRLNTMLVDFYGDYAERLIKEDKKLQAAEVLDKIVPLMTSPQRRNAAQAQAATLRQEAYVAQVRARFEQELKPELVQAERWDDAKGQVLFTIEVEVERKLRPGREEDEAAAQAVALAAFEQEVGALVRKLHALPESVALTGRPEGINVLERRLERGKYALKASVPLEDLVSYGRAMKQRAERATPPSSEADPSPTPAPQAPGAP